MAAKPEAPAAMPPDVAVFVSGLGTKDFLAPAHIAESLCSALRTRAADPEVEFAVARDVVVDRGRRLDGQAVYRVVRRTGAEAVPVLDIYHVAPREVLGIPDASEVPLRRVLRVLPAVVAGTLILVRAAFGPNRRAKSVPQILQLLMCFVVLFALGAYLVIALWALVTALITVVQGDTPVIAWPQWIVLGATALVALLPNWQSGLSQGAEGYLRMMRHIWSARDRDDVVGHVQATLDNIANLPSVERIHVVGYSFGSLIAIDTLYPSSSAHPPQLAKVHSLTTIGCPFDLLRMLSPSYAHSRAPAGQAESWLNVYAPLDLLASNFSTGDGVKHEAETGLQLRGGGERKPTFNEAWNENMTLNLVNLLMLRSLSVHVGYWDRKGSPANAFGLFVELILKKTPVLS